MSPIDGKYILYIMTPEVDYLQDLLLSGFLQKLGHSRVLDLPFSRRIYFPRKTYPAVMIQRKRLSLMNRMFRRFDPAKVGLVVVASCKPLAFERYREILPQIPADVPCVLIDGGDRRDLAGDLDRLRAPDLFQQVEAIRPFDLIFKREYYREDDHGRFLLPLQNGFAPDFLPKPQEPVYEVAFWGVESHPVRSKVLELLEPHFDCVANDSVRGQTFRKFKRKGKRYLEELARCKIAINLPGIGWDCQRYWEAPGVGAAMVTPATPLHIPNDYRNGEHVAHCADDGHDIVEVCQRLLDDDAERTRMARAGQQWALTHHTDVARAQMILDGVRDHLGQTW